MNQKIDYSFNNPSIAEFVKNAKPSALRSLFDTVILCWGVIFCSIGLFIYYPSIFTYALAFLTVSSRMNGCLTLAHEAWHTNLMSSRQGNDFLGGWLCSYPFGSVFGTARAGHLAHHKYLGTDNDPDRPMHNEIDKKTPTQFMHHFASRLFLGQLLTTLKRYLGHEPAINPGAQQPRIEEAAPQSNTSTPKSEFANVVIAQALIGSGLWLASGHWWMYLAVWFLPITTLGTLCYYTRAFCDHARLAVDHDGPHEGRLITVANQLPWERAFLSPFEFNFHAEHHLFASVPHQDLPKLHQTLKDLDGYRSQCIVRPNYSSFLAKYIDQIFKNQTSANKIQQK